MPSNYQSKFSRFHRPIALILLAGLVFLRIPFLGGIEYLAGTRPDWLNSLFQIGTYLLTAILIWWERETLEDFHIDRFAIAIIILFKPIQTIILANWDTQSMQKSPLAFPTPLALVVWVIAFGLALAMWLSQPKLPKIRLVNFLWLELGILGGIGTVILLGYPLSFQTPTPVVGNPFYGKGLFEILVSQSSNFIYQIGFAAVSEEPLFRGFLWGYLRKARWQDRWILFFQSGLFVLGHIYYINRLPISFWVVVPIAALVLGVLAWRSHSIATSMIAHAIINALGYSVALLMAYWRS